MISLSPHLSLYKWRKYPPLIYMQIIIWFVSIAWQIKNYAQKYPRS